MNIQLLIKAAPTGESGDKLRHHGASSERLLARMNRLINDLLDMASIEAGQLYMAPEPLAAAELLDETVDAFAPIAAAKDIALQAEPGSGTPVANVDRGRILQVLANLVSNAIKFTARGGKISVGATREPDGIRFAVSDTGIGVPADALLGLFQRYRQVRKDRRGVGLGLYISKSIVEAHGGRIWAESQPGAGSTFYFTVPSA
jgi:signal transduction histidine kinase